MGVLTACDASTVDSGGNASGCSKTRRPCQGSSHRHSSIQLFGPTNQALQGSSRRDATWHRVGLLAVRRAELWAGVPLYSILERHVVKELINSVGEHGKVYSFDADDVVFSILKKNIDANNRQQRIVPIFGAVHDVPDQTLYLPVQTSCASGRMAPTASITTRRRAGRSPPSLSIHFRSHSRSAS